MRARALLVAMVTTALWSGSYIVNKIAFAQGIGPFTLSGVRYLLAGAVLAAVLKKTGPGRPLPFRNAVIQGLICYCLGQGCQYVGQWLMTPTLSSLLLNTGMVLFVVLADRIQLRETADQSVYWKIAALLLGMLCYYYPWNNGEYLSPAGLIFILLAAFGSAMNVVLNRYMLAKRNVDRRTLTLRPMLVGGAMMLALGVAAEPLPSVNLTLSLCVAYLAFISGAAGFGLWVWSQQHLTAVESGCINNAMIIEIALLDVLCFSRILSFWQWLGVVIIFCAIMLVQMGRREAAA